MSGVQTPPTGVGEADVGQVLRRRLVKLAVVALVAFLWIRVVLFAGVFPFIERHVDNPEFSNDPTTEVDGQVPGDG